MDRIAPNTVAIFAMLEKAASYGVSQDGRIGRQLHSPITYYALPDLRKLPEADQERAIARSRELNQGLAYGMVQGEATAINHLPPQKRWEARGELMKKFDGFRDDVIQDHYNRSLAAYNAKWEPTYNPWSFKETSLHPDRNALYAGMKATDGYFEGYPDFPSDDIPLQELLKQYRQKHNEE